MLKPALTATNPVAKRRPSTRALAGSLIALALAALAGTPAAAADSGFVENEIIVKHRSKLSGVEAASQRTRAGVALVNHLGIGRTDVVRAPEGRATRALAELRRDPSVAYAEPNRPVLAEGSEPLFGDQWGLRNIGQAIRGAAGVRDADIDAQRAWETSMGRRQTVAMVDTGIDLGHEDLDGAIAVNRGEYGSGKEANDRDDDGNGYVDDWRGWDFTGRGDGDSRPADGNGHGTHTAGIVAAESNGLGVAGVAPRAKVMPLRVLGSDGQGKLSNVARAFDYAGDRGTPIVNASLAGSGLSRTIHDVVASHPKTLYVVAAGNAGVDVDRAPVTPCSETVSNVICVGASTNQEMAAWFSNYGRRSVDLFAPGLDVLSTFRGDRYGFMSGTSMAAPHAAGALALMRRVAARRDAESLRAALLRAGDARSAYSSLSVTGRRLNAARAVDRVSP